MTSRQRKRSKADTRALATELHSAAIHLLRKLRKDDDASGISAPRLSALSVVVFGGPLTLGQLAAAEQVRPPTMSRIVTGLEREGLVRRKGAPSDARLTLIHASSKGRKVLLAGRDRRVRTLQSALEKLNAEELAKLAGMSQLLTDVVTTMQTR